MKLRKLIYGLAICASAIYLAFYAVRRTIISDFQKKATACCPFQVGDPIERVRSTWGVGIPIGRPNEFPSVKGLDCPERRISYACETFNATNAVSCDTLLSGAFFVFFNRSNTVEHIYFGKT